MYRPEGFKNPFPEWESLACQVHPKEWQIFEAGAVAYAKSLIKKGVYSDGVWIVEIPDEETQIVREI